MTLNIQKYRKNIFERSNSCLEGSVDGGIWSNLQLSVLQWNAAATGSILGISKAFSEDILTLLWLNDCTGVLKKVDSRCLIITIKLNLWEGKNCEFV